MLLVTTLGLIGTWQVFDQVYVMTQGGPGKSTLTPAYLSYSYAFENQKWGIAAAMAFVLFLIIFAMTTFQRFLFRDKDAIATKRAEKRTKRDRARATARRCRMTSSLRPRRGARRKADGRATGPPCGCSSPTPSCSSSPSSTSTRSSCRSRRRSRPTPTPWRTHCRSIADPFTLGAFQRLFDTDFPLWAVNSVVVTVLVTAGRVFLCSLAGYALARIKFRGRGAIFTALLAVMAVPGVILLIPKFLVLNYLGIYNTYPALVLPLLVDAAGVFIMKQFFETIPESVEEAARIDGASTFRTFWSVVLPMARPALILLTILSFQGSWNELPHFLIASQDPDLFTLTKGVGTLTSGQLGSGQQYPISMAAALLMTIPVALVFFFFQKYLVRGGTAGAEKG